MYNVIVSGTTGFVGQNLNPYLVSLGFTVIPLSRKRIDHAGLTYENLEVKDWNDTSGFVHLAGKAHDTKDTSLAEEYFTVNRDLTIQLFDQFLKSDCSIFIFVSSVKAAADEVNGVLTESDVPNPKTAYGISKLEAERYLLKHLDKTEKKIIILRPCMIHGPGNKGNLNLLYSMVKKGILYPLGAYSNQRSFLSINSLKQVIGMCLQNPPPSGIYNVADDAPLSTVELIKLMGTVLNKRPKILKVPRPIMNTIAQVGGFLKLPLNSNSLQKLTESFVVSNSKIKKALQITDTWDTAAGLENTIESFETKK